MTIIQALTQILNVALFGTLNPQNTTISINILSIGEFTLNIAFLSEILAILLIAITTAILIYYLFDIIIILWKRFTK